MSDIFDELDSVESQEPASSTDIKKVIVYRLKDSGLLGDYQCNDKENGRLYAEIFKSEHRFNTTKNQFMFFDGKRWIIDEADMKARASTKLLTDALYLFVGMGFSDNPKMGSIITPLNNLNKRNSMLQDSKDVYCFSNADMDADDFILNVQNGILDLNNDNPVLLPHNPDYLLSKISNASYNPDATCKTWDKFLDDIMQGDKEKIQFLQKIAGIGLTGDTREECMFILYGSTTRNGKSTFCETLLYLYGDYGLTMKPETLAMKQNNDSRQANGDVARLDGCRFANASEPQRKMIFDIALLKTLLGRDTITARHIHERQFEFKPKFKLCMNTNYLPIINDDTVFHSGRIHVVTFDRHFEPHEQDKTLKHRLIKDDELSGILNWCIEGLRLYRKEGLTPPASILNATRDYQSEQDKLGNFIDECLIYKEGVIKPVREIYDRYSQWCKDNGFGVESKGNFTADLKKKGLYAKSGTIAGKTVRNVVKDYVRDDNPFTMINGKRV